MDSIYTLSFNAPKGNEIALEDYRGRVLLLVNTATKCGLAGQFTELQTLHEKYKDKGLVVIGFPCDQFMGQEPESNESIVAVCQVNFGVTFQLSELVEVNGSNTHPIFDYLKHHSKSTLGNEIKWNFTKFLVSGDGLSINRYAPTTSPLSMEDDIVKLLS
jgi:glutathione peroxidase